MREELKRPPREDDNEKIEQGIDLIFDLIEKNDQIEISLWTSILFASQVKGYINCEWTYDQFKREIKKMIKHYEKWWDNE